jgi:hypothetical protein
MPKHEAMAQLSRPFQIALVAVVLFAGVWLFALQGHSTTTGGAGSAATVSPSAPTTTVAHKPARTTGKVSSHTSSTRAAAAPASHKVSTSTTHAPVHRAAKTVTKTATQAPTKAVTKAPATTVAKAPARPATAHEHASTQSTTTLSGQHAVEGDLAKGDVVVLLFWNPSGVEDVTAHQAVQKVKTLNHVAVREAAASQVASYGSVTRGVQVDTTPTILVINKRGQALVLTGVQDSFSIEQAIAEARSS